MYRIRLWFAVAILWLLFLFNIERFHEPINIASFVYVLAALVAASLVVFAKLRQVSFFGLCCMILASFLVVKWTLGYALLGGALPLTITEGCVLVLTALISTQISREAAEFESSVDELTLRQYVGGITPANSDYNRLYREVQRARRYGRPLGVLALNAVAENDIGNARLLEEIQRKSVKEYVNAKLGQVVGAFVSESDLISRDGDHLVVAMPEASQSEMNELASKLSEEVKSKYGWRAGIGTALFPSEEVTLTGLLERASQEMQEGGKDQDEFVPNVRCDGLDIVDPDVAAAIPSLDAESPDAAKQVPTW